MGRKSTLKKRRKEKITFEAVDRVVLGSAPQVRNRSTTVAVCGILFLAVIGVFVQTAGHEFVNYDDNDYVYENSHVKAGLTTDGIAWAMTTFDALNWHPLTWLSHMLDCQLYGLNPSGHHVTNVLLHAAASIILFLALRRMTGALWPSAWVAAIFAVHPLRVESVAWVAERKDGLSGLFFMLTLWFYARYVERPASRGRYLLVVASFALGLTAKPMLVTLPFVLLLLDNWPLGRLGSASKKSLLVEKIPLFVLAAASCVITLAAQSEAIRPLAKIAFSERLANAVIAYVAYLGKMVYPANLAVLYPLPRGLPPAAEVVAAVTVLLAISTAVFVARRKRPYLLFGWLWYLGTLAPVIGLVQVGGQAMADRYTYLSQIGLYMAIAWGAADAVGAWPHRQWAFAAVASLVVAGLIVCAWQQTGYWQNSETLWVHTLACNSRNSVAHNNLGLILAGRGQLDDAIVHYRKAVEVEPDYAAAHNNLGMALAARGQFGEAIDEFRKVLDIQPNFVPAHYNLGKALADSGQVQAAIASYQKALEIKPDYAEAHNNLGIALAGIGRVSDADYHYRKALAIKPDYVDAHINLGKALAAQKHFDEANAHYRKAIELKPDAALAYVNLGIALAQNGHVEEAIVHLRKGLELKPDDFSVHYNLGLALADGRKFDEAIDHFRKALEIKPDLPGIQFSLGNALSDIGRRDEAQQHYRTALGLASAQNNTALAALIRAKMD